jgi:hypothetical protein
MRRVDGVADVPGKQLDVTRGSDPQINATEFPIGGGANHAEEVCRHLVNRVGRESRQLQCEISVRQVSRINWSGRIRHAPVLPDWEMLSGQE